MNIHCCRTRALGATTSGFARVALFLAGCTATGLPVDVDGDGYALEEGDCDDTDTDVHPGAREVCDGRDDDCDGAVDTDAVDRDTYHRDGDGDGFGDPGTFMTSCTAPNGWTGDSSDCHDGDTSIHPGAVEVCDQVDNDCDSETDEGTLSEFYPDEDSDEFGDAAAAPIQACDVSAGLVSGHDDCDDQDASIYPGAEEIYDQIDNDCDGKIDCLDDLICIQSCITLEEIGNNLSGHYVLEQDVDCTFDTSDPQGALYRSGEGFRPIGDNNARFTGTLDGQYHVISGLHINRPYQDAVGLFGAITSSDSVVRSLFIKDVVIAGGSDVGGLVGSHELGAISGIELSGSVTGAGSYVGGLAGELYNSAGVNDARVDVSVSGGDFVGGLVGRARDGTMNRIVNSASSGDVTATGSYVGGLVGYDKSVDLVSCYATGDVVGGDVVGGLLGAADENAGLDNTYYAEGVVQGDRFVGGIVGQLNAYHDGVRRTYFAGQVVGLVDYVGGFLGDYVAGALEANYWDQSSNASLAASGDGEDLPGVVALDAEQWTSQTTFEGADWDFTPGYGFWEMDSYPRLQIKDTSREVCLSTGASVTVQPADNQKLAAGDLDGDGRADLVIAHWFGQVGVLLQRADGGIAPETLYPVYGSDFDRGATNVTIADIDLDGSLDLIVPTYGDSLDNVVTIWHGTGGGEFTDPRDVNTLSANPMAAAVADVNRDGRPDLVVSHNNAAWLVVVLLQNADGEFEPAGSYAGGQNPQFLDIGDFNDDGWPDVVAGVLYSGVYVYLNTASGTGELWGPYTYLEEGGHLYVKTADVNGDRFADIVSRSIDDNSVTVLYGDMDGMFPTQSTFEVDSAEGFLGVGDLNGDGRGDIVTANQYSGDVSVLINRWDGTFLEQQPFPAGPAPWGVAFGDFNGDGWPDVAVADLGTDEVSILQNTSCIQ